MHEHHINLFFSKTPGADCRPLSKAQRARQERDAKIDQFFRDKIKFHAHLSSTQPTNANKSSLCPVLPQNILQLCKQGIDVALSEHNAMGAIKLFFQAYNASTNKKRDISLILQLCINMAEQEESPESANHLLRAIYVIISKLGEDI